LLALTDFVSSEKGPTLKLSSCTLGTTFLSYMINSYIIINSNKIEYRSNENRRMPWKRIKKCKYCSI